MDFAVLFPSADVIGAEGFAFVVSVEGVDPTLFGFEALSFVVAEETVDQAVQWCGREAGVEGLGHIQS